MKRAVRAASLSIVNKELMDEAAHNTTAAAFVISGAMRSLNDVMKERPRFKPVDYVIRIEARNAAAKKEDDAEARDFAKIVSHSRR